MVSLPNGSIALRFPMAPQRAGWRGEGSSVDLREGRVRENQPDLDSTDELPL
jgi:hypothetical protein